MLRRQFLKNLLWINRTLVNETQKSDNSSFRSTALENITPIKLAYNVFESSSTSKAPPILILHGLFGSKQNWRSISKAIEAKSNPRRKVISLDARNHGESPHSQDHSYKALAADILQLYQDLNLKKAILMGHSMGARAMMYFTLNYPDLVDRAVFVDITPINISSSLSKLDKVFNAMQTVHVDANMSMSEGRQKAQQQLLKSLQNQETVNFLILNLRKSEEKGFYWITNVDGLSNNFNHLSSFPRDELASLKYNGPVLFIGGRKSDFIEEASFPQVKESFPNAQLTWLDTGHLVQLEKPTEFVSLVLNFINSNSL